MTAADYIIYNNHIVLCILYTIQLCMCVSAGARVWRRWSETPSLSLLLVCWCAPLPSSDHHHHHQGALVYNIYMYYIVRYNGLVISKFAADAHCSTYNNILRIVYTWQPDAGPNTTTAADTVRAPPPPLPVQKRISAVLISPTRVVDTYIAREAASYYIIYYNIIRVHNNVYIIIIYRRRDRRTTVGALARSQSNAHNTQMRAARAHVV